MINFSSWIHQILNIRRQSKKKKKNFIEIRLKVSIDSHQISYET